MPAPVAREALECIAQFCAVEKALCGPSDAERRAGRQAHARPLVTALKQWFEAKLDHLAQKSDTAKALRYALRHWEGLTLYLIGGRIEMDTNAVERAMRPIKLNAKNALFAGCDEGAENWAVLASLIETCKLNGVSAEHWLADVLATLVNGWPAARLDELLPWASIYTMHAHDRFASPGDGTRKTLSLILKQTMQVHHAMGHDHRLSESQLLLIS